MSFIVRPGHEGIIVNLGDHRDPKVRRAILDRIFSGENYVQGQENTKPADENVGQQKEPKAGKSDKPHVPKGYMLAPVVIGNNYVGPPEVVVPLICLICSKHGHHLAKNCPHRNDEKYTARFKIFGSKGVQEDL